MKVKLQEPMSGSESLELRVLSLGFKVGGIGGLRFLVSGLGVLDLVFWGLCLVFRDVRFWFWVSGFGFRVLGFAFRS